MDTKKITLELLATGLTQQELADMVGCSQPTINAFARGKRGSRPTFDLGLRLVQLHQQRCHRAPEPPAANDVPTKDE